MHARALLLLCAFAWLGWSTDARAGVENCTVSTLDVAFGTYDITSASPLDGTGQVIVDCQANTVPVTIAIGTGGGGAYGARRMVFAPDVLTYELYTDPARTTPWGDGTSGTSTVTCSTGVSSNGCIGSNPSGGNRRAVRAVYGRIPALQNVGVGTYTDAITVTVTF